MIDCEWEIVGARVVVRVGAHMPLAQLAAEGPGSTHRCRPPSKEPEPVHRLQMTRPIYASPKGWEEHCPRPAGWSVTAVTP